MLALQELDDEITRATACVEEFTPQLAELEQPVSVLAAQIDAARSRVDDLRREIDRLENAAEQKRGRLEAYEERLQHVRNMREQSAARVEMDLIRRAAEADEEEALSLMEQATRTDLKLDELERQMAKLEAETEPKLKGLLAEKAEAEANLAIAKDRRENQAIRLEKPTLRMYERVRAGRSAVALAPMTDEGACGNCFNVLPLQEQSEVRSGGTLHRCEACGVILYVP